MLQKIFAGEEVDGNLMFDLRCVSHEMIHTAHIWLFRLGLSRLTLFTLIYIWHLWIPLIGLLIFIMFPVLRPAIAVFITMVLISQLLFRTCVVAKLEWKIMPEADGVTWTTADIIKLIGIKITKPVRFWWMIWCTSCALLFLYVIHWVLPDGLRNLSAETVI
jgi:hypothetical protein